MGAYSKDVEQSNADSSDESVTESRFRDRSGTERSSRDTSGSLAPERSSLTDTSDQPTPADSAVGPQSGGPDTREQYEQRHGVDIDTPGQAERLQRLERSNSLATVKQWADEGIPIEAMGTPSEMHAFRQWKGTGGSGNVEQQNTQSVQGAEDTGPAEETQVHQSVRDVVSAPGKPVDPALRKSIESEIGQSLGHARVHRGPAADAACDQFDAIALTVDNHVAVRSDQPDPATPAGQHLMSHELTHVAQQTGGDDSPRPDAGTLVVDSDPQLEQEAEATAQRVLQGGEPGTQRLQNTPVQVQRMQHGRNNPPYMQMLAAQLAADRQDEDEEERDENQGQVAAGQNQGQVAAGQNQGQVAAGQNPLGAHHDVNQMLAAGLGAAQQGDVEPNEGDANPAPALGPAVGPVFPGNQLHHLIQQMLHPDSDVSDSDVEMMDKIFPQ